MDDARWHEKRSIKDRIKAQLKELEAEIDRLDEKSKVFDETLKTQYKKRAADYRKMIAEGRSSIDALAKAGETGVEIIDDFAEFTLKALKKSVDYLHEQFRDDGDRRK